MTTFPNKKKNAFVLTSTDHGTMIVNRFDYQRLPDGRSYGVGHELLDFSSFSRDEIDRVVSLLHKRRDLHGDGVVAIDGGANVGAHSLAWGRAMLGWGGVIAFEAQERVFYALAGNIALNNLINVRALNVALAARAELLTIPEPDYLTPASFGSYELRRNTANEDFGQSVYGNRTVSVSAIPIDQLGLERLDLLKLDIEGMEIEALEGARETIGRCRPVVFVEWIKSGKAPLVALLAGHGYEVFEDGLNLLAIHKSDRMLENRA